MPVQPKPHVAEFLERLLADIGERLPSDEAAQAREFLHRYYNRVSSDDLAERDLVDLRGAALAHWQLARRRLPGQSLVRVYNPDFEKHGWQSTHTVVETVMEDRPFLVDSVSIALNRHGLTVHLIVHPVMWVDRDDDGRLTAIGDRGTSETATAESMMRFEVDRQGDTAALAALATEIERVLGDVRRATTDWKAMREQVLGLIDGLKAAPSSIPGEDVEEAQAFLRWVEDHHFTLLGYCEYSLNGNGQLTFDEGSGLGLFRETGEGTAYPPADTVPVEAPEYVGRSQLLVVAKSNRRATIHRRAHMDFIGVRRFNKRGEVDGECCILGLFASVAYSRNPREIPYLRHKISRVIETSALSPTSHEGKALQNVLDTYPRDALFQISEPLLLDTAMGILDLQERQRIRLFVRRDDFGRFYSCMLYIPRERWSRELRLKVQDIMLDAFGGTELELNAQFGESILARVHVVIQVREGARPSPDVREVEQRIIDAARSWQDDVRAALIEKFGEPLGNAYYQRYGDAFPSAYSDDFDPRTAAYDVARMEAVREGLPLGMAAYRPLEETAGAVRMKLFSARHPISPSDALPLIENMGLRVMGERPYQTEPRDSDPIWIHEYNLIQHHGREIDPDADGERFLDALSRVWAGELENDRFNQLVLGAGLDWREVVVFRAYCRYLRQIRIQFSEAYIIDSLARHPRLSRLLKDLFVARLDPSLSGRDARIEELVDAIERDLDAVANLDEDRILRSYLNVIQATIRTNYFQRAADGSHKSYLSFKFDPAKITRMPDPRPMFEIFVYSPRTEAVHLRGGKVARGGLRWSDRREDFRTEVLGLVKAQMVKNAVIVPVGSKGGFVVKRPPEGGDRETLMAEVVECYRIFIRGMLDITDNIRGPNIIPPADVVRHDEDDPYLVVAADKGTATFSDIANQLAIDYGFWMGDAFASGGSAGYDHKGMGITARGAWESVKRHFRELGLNTQTTDFTVLGIGDMSGDVFGNGMLLSEHIRLVGAFNHMHIFLDPEPDAASSFAERKRLFALPRSSWEDYDKSLISAGGGIWPRSAKAIALSPEVQKLLRVKAEKLTPNELINVMLKAPVDLLWNGGIGTYIKASDETHEAVDDKTNDSLRVSANELRCKVIGEGGNLGVTQRARIEFALGGGHVYTDAIDNSAGVDCSDHEVNIKILLNQVIENGDMTVKQRNRLLEDMTDEVADLVLQDNYGQTQAINHVLCRAPVLLDEHERLIRQLERAGRLDRAMEFLPDDKGFIERRNSGRGLVAPELSVLLAYSKMAVFGDLVDSDVPEGPFLSRELHSYFPDRLGERFDNELQRHRLRREIIATHVTNSLVNRLGPSFPFRLREETGVGFAEVARAFAAARAIFDMDRLWADIESLDNRVAAATQSEAMILVNGLVERTMLWLLRSRRGAVDIATTVETYRDGVAQLSATLPKPLSAAGRLSMNRRTKALVSEHVPSDVASRIAAVVPLSSALDIVEVAQACERDVASVATVYFDIGETLELQWLREQIGALEARTHWHRLAKSALRHDVHTQQRHLAAEAIGKAKRTDRIRNLVDSWIADNQVGYDRFMQVINDLKTSESIDFAMLSVGLSEVHALLDAPGAREN